MLEMLSKKDIEKKKQGGLKQMKRKCVKCGYEWESRLKTKPIECPDCKNRNWDKPIDDRFKKQQN